MKRSRLLPLAGVYEAGLALKNVMLERGMLEQRRLGGRVVSVGSLSAGGAGKTPMAMLVVELLRAAGLRVDVLSRGYGRAGTGVEHVDPDGNAARYGDEPMLMARRLGVPVWVGRSRFAAGSAAEILGGTEDLVHVLDDGFQHRRLARDVDLVLLTRRDTEDALLPAGNLREALDALGRADIVVLREEEEGWLRAFVAIGKAVWVIRRTIRFNLTLPERPLVFCGIARPEGFLEEIAAMGVNAAAVVQFPDHQRYGEREVLRLMATAVAAGADGFVTTEKDAVKLTWAMQQQMGEVGSVVVAGLRVELVQGHVEDLLEKL